MSIDYTYHYRKFDKGGAEQERRTSAYYHRILARHLPSDISAPILDVGCGSGLLLQSLKELGYSNLAGVELDSGQAETARRRGFNVDVAGDTASWLGLRKGAYKTILATDVLEHVPVAAQIDFVRAIGESLAEGGVFICTVPNANSALASRWRHIDWTHTCSFTEVSLDFLLHHGGLNVKTIEPVEFGLPPKLWWLPRPGWFFFLALKTVRWWRRTEMMVELGPAAGRSVPLSLNIMAVATKNPR